MNKNKKEFNFPPKEEMEKVIKNQEITPIHSGEILRERLLVPRDISSKN
jgi:hypothetical protein